MDELQMMMLIKTLAPIIAIFIIGIYLVYALKKKDKENVINKDGIRIKYNNEFIKKNYYEYLVEKYGKEKADQIDLNIITQNNMMEMCKAKELKIIDFTENDMLITWDALESWDGYLKDAEVIGARIYFNTSLKYIEVKIFNMPIKIKIYVTPFSNKMYYFKRMAKEKRINHTLFFTIFYFILNLFFMLLIVIACMELFKR